MLLSTLWMVRMDGRMMSYSWYAVSESRRLSERCVMEGRSIVVQTAQFYVRTLCMTMCLEVTGVQPTYLAAPLPPR